MKILAVGTATESCSAALWLDGEIRERFEAAGREHSQLLPRMVQALLAECGVAAAQIDGIAASAGPGSFAGVRVGVAFVKGFAQALDRPVLPVSSLAMLAQSALDRGAPAVLPAIDARMREVYFGVYESADGVARARCPDAVLPPAQVPPVGGGMFAAVGSGWKAYADLLAASTAAQLLGVDGEAQPHAADALRLTVREFAAGRGLPAAALQPLYLRDRVALTAAEQQAARDAARGAQRAEK
ncbi:MAG: tRNA (adenosine(37)-N6)-threonylcarbamoyltransferase complex dimerization subunit type 1 TsaB [Nevskia sp.]|nr:tRNA (adenosine(37)-N6)-threonylcarbamoyltransferase complex dimerization subunit type 1 TsaB [Nevskia sp.]